MICARCGHPPEWHYDRAVIACSGYLPDEGDAYLYGPEREARDVTATHRCNCTGYVQPRKAA